MRLPASVGAGPERDLVEDFRGEILLEPIAGTVLLHGRDDCDSSDRLASLVDNEAAHRSATPKRERDLTGRINLILL